MHSRLARPDKTRLCVCRCGSCNGGRRSYKRYGCKEMGFFVLGDDLAAVDATCARTMGFDPYELDYIQRLPVRL